ncbi:DUF1003 domain-containing protein [Segetibacter aerophilus]|uniref:Cyclic nucleotide-binding protein n=1 Tax=Segetibacter aerophilus TaxID=670293 RepID=A0A512BI68_9BACT|nr:DUF1003 domain-containing protein [Segetibacter aerophilus]GEO11672.1 hypothetical protein SAE01_41680 [Segetibacter aerophilus]
MQKVTCSISNQVINENEAHKGDTLRASLFDLIKQEHPNFTSASYISNEELNVFRKKQLSSLINQENGELNSLEKEVVQAVSSNKILSENIEDELEEKLTFGQRIADHIATFGGSWTFIISFFCFIVVWMGINIWMLSNKPFDPYPFILLNLILSCLAAIQAPIIMMSQNRQEHKDRIRSEHDYKINLKAELEIQLLNEKVDHLIIHQNKRLMEIQQIQADYLDDILKELKLKE